MLNCFAFQISKEISPCRYVCLRTFTLDFDLSDPQDVLPFLCKEHKNLGMLGQEKKGWSSPRNFRLTSMPAMPKIESRPCAIVDQSLMLMGGRFVAKTDAACFEVDVAEFNLCLENFAMVDKERQSNHGYVASFLAALEIFSSWPWLEVVELSTQVKSVQVDKGVNLLSQGERVDGIHIIHRGEAQMEFEDVCAHRPAGTCDPLIGRRQFKAIPDPDRTYSRQGGRGAEVATKSELSCSRGSAENTIILQRRRLRMKELQMLHVSSLAVIDFSTLAKTSQHAHRH